MAEPLGENVVWTFATADTARGIAAGIAVFGLWLAFATIVAGFVRRTGRG